MTFGIGKSVAVPAYLSEVAESVKRFVRWLEGYGETSYDHQGLYAGPLGRKAKTLYYRKPVLGTIAVAPMVFCEAIFPAGRRLFWKKQRLPIADAHYAMGFAYLSETWGDHELYEKALHFLDVLENTRCHGYRLYGWGYPFDWVTRNGTTGADTPLITITPYVYEAFNEAYRLDGNPRWKEVMRSIAEHVAYDIRDFDYGPGCSTCSYTPHDLGGVINASAYRAFVLLRASIDLAEKKYQEIAEKNLNFVLATQQENGAWRYSVDNARDFVDHFHTCFVLKALAKIEGLTGHEGCRKALERGVHYYLEHLFDEKGLPKPFSKAPRLKVYRRVLYDYAECINLGVLLRGRFFLLDEKVSIVVSDLLSRWQKKDGSFYARELFLGWDHVPMHRYAQAQIFRSLCLLLREENRNRQVA